MKASQDNAVARLVADAAGLYTRIDVDNQVFGRSFIAVVPFPRDEVCCRLLSVFMDEEEGRINRNRETCPYTCAVHIGPSRILVRFHVNGGDPAAAQRRMQEDMASDHGGLHALNALHDWTRISARGVGGNRTAT